MNPLRVRILDRALLFMMTIDATAYQDLLVSSVNIVGILKMHTK